MSTYLGSGYVVLLAPPAEAALLIPAAARELAKNLVAQADEAEASQKTPGSAVRLQHP
ncbi:hypothetical protein [Amycolatopsis pittospori]|uniref:hypothetical protein n=1 Tax=Amycolatopsis pittospori TaxID=2749434 RepID=UPI0015F0ECC6|nr:hypothetical protein [Amycolatopsis pittospori]